VEGIVYVASRQNDGYLDNCMHDLILPGFNIKAPFSTNKHPKLLARQYVSFLILHTLYSILRPLIFSIILKNNNKKSRQKYE
jgi:hypothetical protein